MSGKREKKKRKKNQKVSKFIFDFFLSTGTNRYLSWIRNNTVDACYCDAGLVGAVGASTSTELPSTGGEEGVGSSDDTY